MGVVNSKTPNENVKDKNLITRISRSLAHGSDGIEDYSHILIIFWLHKTPRTEKHS